MSCETALTTKTTCAVTGANGYVGGVIVRHLRAAGHPVVCLQRAGAGNTSHGLTLTRAGWEIRHYALQEPPGAELFVGVGVLVHCAYDFSTVTWPGIDAVNVRGTARLFTAARDAGVERIIFISSISAFDGCSSYYGRAKLATESRAKEFNAVIVRPGLVYGKASGGMVGALDKLIRFPSPLLPIVDFGSQAMVLVHEDDLGQLIVKLAVAEPVPVARPIIAGAEERKSFKEILRILAQSAGRRVIFMPVPWRLIWAALRIGELTGVRLRLRSDSLVSLMRADPHPDFSAAREFGVRYRSLEEAMQ